MLKLTHVDNGKAFDFGKAAKDYALYRDIYTESFFQTLLTFDIGTIGQEVLDLGTGSGVIPRYMHKYGARWTGADISPDQIEMAKALTREKNLDIEYLVCPADDIAAKDNTFDVVTACQCFWYFPIKTTIPEIKRVLKPQGKFAILSMMGLPRESEILAKSEELVLKFNPSWNSSDFDRKKPEPPDWLENNFSIIALHDYVENVPFTRESWCGRMRACRGVGASLAPDLVKQYDEEHYMALCEIAEDTFEIPHQFLFQIYEPIK
ncbi:MAG: class I SAM-dependent methyltransferase [Lachnospiraceae bacterium]|nr:class I SAM-dependent methyltransferase [Lachnospiraceae bacterium]